MKKYIEWLNEQVGELNITDAVFNDSGVSYIDTAVSIDRVYGLINQLGEPEVLSQELPVIPKYVAEWIEENRKVYEDKFFIIGYDLYDNAIHLAVGDWIVDNQEKFVKAWFDGYEVKKEKRYYVDLDSTAYVAKWKEDGQVNIYTDAIFGSDEFEFFLTEQEIKNFDDRFWAFAEPAEQWN